MQQIDQAALVKELGLPGMQAEFLGRLLPPANPHNDANPPYCYLAATLMNESTMSWCTMHNDPVDFISGINKMDDQASRRADRNAFYTPALYNSAGWKEYDRAWNPATSKFDSDEPHPRAGQARPERKKESVKHLACFWYDIDAGKHYADFTAALAAFADFLEATKAQEFGADWMLVASGGGLHAYLPMECPIPPDKWLPRAIALQDLAGKHRLHADKVTRNPVCVLRLPGTRNFKPKYAPDYPVVEWLADADAPCTTENLDNWLKNNRIQQEKVSANPAKFVPAGGGAADALVDGCAVMRAVIALDDPLQGDWYDDWFAALTNIAFCENPYAELTRLMPNKTAREETKRNDPGFAQDIINTRIENGMHPVGCRNFAKGRSELCHGCPLFGKRANPFALVQQQDRPAEVVEGQAKRLLLRHASEKEELMEALEAIGMEARFNLRSHELELRWRDPVQFTRWTPLNDRLSNDVRMDWLPKQVDTRTEPPAPYRPSKEAFRNLLLAIGNRNAADPFIEYLQALPAIRIAAEPGDLRIDSLFFDLFAQEPQADDDIGVSKADDALWHCHIGRLLFLAAVHRTLRPGCKFDHIIMLQGQQGAGKDTLIEHAPPQDLQEAELTTTTFSLMDSEKERVEKTLGCLYVVDSEMAGITKSNDIEKLKKIITARTDKCRLAYRENAESIPRRFIIVCTTNDARPLPEDPTGNRRWLPVCIQQPRAVKRVEDWYEDIITPQDDPRLPHDMKRRDVLWAEAYQLYLKDPTDMALVLPDHIRRLRDLKNGAVENIADDYEDMFNEARQSAGFNPATPLKNSAVAAILGFISHTDDFSVMPKRLLHDIRKLMTRLGWKSGRKRVLLDGGDEARISVWYCKDTDFAKRHDRRQVYGSKFQKAELGERHAARDDQPKLAWQGD